MNKLYGIKHFALLFFLCSEINLDASARSHRSFLPLLIAPQKRDRDDSSVSSRASSVSVAPTAGDGYGALVSQQRNFLLQQFCNAVGITKDAFFKEYDEQRAVAERYILRQDTGAIQSPVMQNAIRRIRRLCGDQLVHVRQIEQQDPLDCCRSIGVVGTDVTLYAPFFGKTAEQQEVELEEAAMQVGSYDAHCVSAMHAVLWQKHALPKKRCMQAHEFISLYSALVGPSLKMRAWLKRVPSSVEATGGAPLSGNQSDIPLATQQSAVSAASSGSVVFCGQNDRAKYLQENKK